MAIKKIRINTDENRTEYLELEFVSNRKIRIQIGSESELGGAEESVIIEKENFIQLIRMIGLMKGKGKN